MGKNNRGFTLTELLIVIVLVGIVSSFVIYTNVQTSLKKSRDAVRKTNVEQIRTAMEMYKEDHGSYPTGGSLYSFYIAACDSGSYFGSCSGPCNCYCDWGGPWICNGVTYMSSLPNDPLVTIGGFVFSRYHYGRDVTTGDYRLAVCLENSNDFGPNTAIPSSSNLFPALCTSPSRVYYITK